MDIVVGTPFEVEGQSFTGYTKAVKTIEEVNDLYGKVKSLNVEARHVVCAFRLPHRNFHTHQDFVDDEEHNGGAYLLRLLTDSDIKNRAIFVARTYDGTHLGSRRYDAMREAVASALAKAGKNIYTDRYDVLWDLTADNRKPDLPKGGRGGKHVQPLQRRDLNLGKAPYNPAWSQEDPPQDYLNEDDWHTPHDRRSTFDPHPDQAEHNMVAT